jgi:serine/threonine protein kinase/Tol biopolymer transport system component
MTGQLLGHYRVLEQIGAGGMGDVYRARDERLGRDVALKLIRPSSAKDPDRLHRFEHEARAAAALNHPNIVAIYDIGFHEGMPFIVSELLEGKTLRDRLAAGALSVREASDYGLEISEGLMAAHDKHIVHRDLKPENLFITKDNRIKILDFGIAKLVHPETDKGSAIASLTTQTRSGSVLGTVAYMSPEQLRAKPVDARSDIFSLGAILYEMLTGRRAFRGETDVDTITAVLRETPPEVTHERANVPKAFEQIVNHCLEKEPEKRFQSVRDLIFSLETLSAGSPKVGSWTISAPVRKAVLVVLGLGLLIGVGWLLGSWISSGASNPEYHRLTFERGTVYGARFTPDGRSVVYEASWHGQPPRLFSTVSTSPQAQALDVNDAHLLAVSRSNQMALQLHGRHGTFLDYVGGTLAQMPLAGGAPRELQEDVRWADWDPTAQNEMAVVHYTGGRSRLEFPAGKVLYQSPGSITNIRFSPAGDKIAFMDHPVLWDDRGFVRMVDRAGHVTTLSPEWESEAGLAWNPKGDEVWFTAAAAGYNRKLMAVNLSGKARLVLAAPDGLNLQDIAPDGRALISTESQRVALEAIVPPDKQPHDLSWYDWSVAKDISRDGQWFLFEESGEPFGGHYAVSVRRLLGAPIHLGDGSAGGFSPDGKWALSVSASDPPHVTLLPVGPGVSREVPVSGLEHVQNGSARFMPDGQQIIINGNETGHSVRGYLVSMTGGKPRPVTPEGVAALLISPDGRYVTAQGLDSSVALCSVEKGTIEPIPGIAPGDYAAQWTADGMGLYLYRYSEVPARIFRLDLHSGKRTLTREIQPAELAGVVAIGPIVMSPDASRFAYSYYQNLSTLFLISGLH